MQNMRLMAAVCLCASVFSVLCCVKVINLLCMAGSELCLGAIKGHKQIKLWPVAEQSRRPSTHSRACDSDLTSFMCLLGPLIQMLGHGFSHVQGETWKEAVSRVPSMSTCCEDPQGSHTQAPCGLHRGVPLCRARTSPSVVVMVRVPRAASCCGWAWAARLRSWR